MQAFRQVPGYSRRSLFNLYQIAQGSSNEQNMKKEDNHNLKTLFHNPELSFLITCTAPFLSGKKLHHEMEEPPRDIDWDIFLRLAIRHRLIPSVRKFVKTAEVKMPPRAFRAIEAAAEENTRIMLGLTGELLRLTRIFTKNGIRVIALKGPALAYQLYGDPGGRQSMDLDLLVSPKDGEAAHRLLKADRYQRIEPSFELSRRQAGWYTKKLHHFRYSGGERNTVLELHWRFFTPASLFPRKTEQIMQAAKTLNIPGWDIEVLSDRDQILYLASHGAMHQWYRLGWLKDFCEFVRKFPFRQGAVSADAKNLGLSAPLDQAFRLADLLDGTAPAGLERRGRRRSILTSSLRAIERSESEILTRKLQRLAYTWYLMKLRKNLRYKFDCLAKSGTHPHDWRLLPLPDRWFPVYYVLRPFLYLYHVYMKRM